MAERTCIVTREVCDPAGLIRFVAGPDGTVVPDIKRKLPGRGVWVSATRDHVQKAVGKSLFARSLKANVKAAPDLPDRVEMLLCESTKGALGLARKAGQCVVGAGKVEDTIRAGKAIGALHAADGSQDGLRKIRQAVLAAAKGGRGIPVWRVLTIDEMSLALGATHVIHAALTHGDAARSCAASVAALAAYRGCGNTEDPEPL